MKEQRFRHIRSTNPAERAFDTINLVKEERHERVLYEVHNRVSWAGGWENIPTDFRTSAFDLFTNWLAKPCFDERGRALGPWRLGFRETYRKVLNALRLYRAKSANQYAAGYKEKPHFLCG